MQSITDLYKMKWKLLVKCFLSSFSIFLNVFFCILQNDIKGDITFTDVEFTYPTRQNVPILQKFNIKIPRGRTVAFVGASGCGKSTSVSLLERFYDVAGGEVVSPDSFFSWFGISLQGAWLKVTHWQDMTYAGGGYFGERAIQWGSL